jgi:hypothetical protein
MRSTARRQHFWLHRSFHFLSTLRLLSRKVCLVKDSHFRDSVHAFADPRPEPLVATIGIVTVAARSNLT